MPTDADIVVIGGGPAGAAAAIVGARAGARVVLVDKARFPRDKCCGDGLTSGALRRLETLGLRPDEVKSWQWVDDVRVRSCSGRVAHYPLPRAEHGHFAAVARRIDLDAALLDVAREAGVAVHEGAALTAIYDAGANVVVTVDGHGELRADHVVAADGMWSPTRKLLDAWSTSPAASRPTAPLPTAPTPAPLPANPPYLGEWHAYRQYFRHTQVNELWVWFEADILPGYVWAFPLPDGGANVGFGVERRRNGPPTKTMKALWPAILARPHIAAILGPDAEPEEPPKAWPIPAAIDTAELVRGRILFVGDAARACDVLTGEGIGQALQTGMTAAAAITGREYEHIVRSSLGPDHRMASMLQRAMRHEWVCRAAVKVSDTSAWTRRNFGRWLFEDYPRGIALTPRQWHRGALSGSGSYSDLPH